MREHALAVLGGATYVLWNDERFVDVRTVLVTSSRIMRTRPIFSDWSLTFDVAFEPGFYIGTWASSVDFGDGDESNSGIHFVGGLKRFCFSL